MLRGSVPELLTYRKGLITERCRKFPVPKSADELLCMDQWGAQVTLWSYLYTVRFGKDGHSEMGYVFETIGMSRQACGINFFDESKTSVERSEISGLEFGSTNKSAPLLEVVAVLGERYPTEEERKACQRGKPVPLSVKTYQLHFLFDGDRFRATRETEDKLRQFPKPGSLPLAKLD